MKAGNTDSPKLRANAKTEYEASTAKIETVSYAVDWSKAPDWANYHVFEPYRKGYWHKFAPTFNLFAGWEMVSEGGEQGNMQESFFTLPYNGNAADSLTKRETNYTVDWTKAPAWAMYHIYNEDGMGSWYKFKPVWTGYWLARGEGGVEPQIKASHFSVDDRDSKHSLTERPKQAKPVIDWSTAPRWANYHAFDNDGKGWWYASKPVRILVGWDVDRASDISCSPSGLWSTTHDQWRDSLVKRP
jgi:hypothetical protein